MGYLLRDIDLDEPFPRLALAAEDSGVGLVLRQGGMPIGFLLRPLAAGSLLEPEELARLVAAEAGFNLLHWRLRSELAPKRPESSVSSLSVAICTRNRPELLRLCLERLMQTRTAEGDSFATLLAAERAELLVVDNAPSDERTATLAAGYPKLRYFREPVAGLDVARNRALAEAKGEVIAFLDDDTEAEPQWLAGLFAAFAEHPETRVVTGQVMPRSLASEAEVLFEERGGFRRGYRQIRYGPQSPSDPLHPCGAGIFGAGANMAFRRAALLELGGFDEALDTGPPLPGGGDLDIFYRALRQGGPLVYDPRMAVRHRHRQDMKGLRRQYYTWGLGFLAFLAKSFGTDPPLRRRLLLTLAWWTYWELGLLARSLLGRGSLSPRMVLSELAGGLLGLAGEYRRSQRRMAARRKAAG